MDEPTPPGERSADDARERPALLADGSRPRMADDTHDRGQGAVGESFGLDVDGASPAGRAGFEQAAERVPEEWEIEGPAVSISLGDAADVDPVLLAAMTGPTVSAGRRSACSSARTARLTRCARARSWRR